jgi:protein-arginine kinase
VVDELFILTQPAHLQHAMDRRLTAEERDACRAELVRQKLRNARRADRGEQT